MSLTLQSLHGEAVASASTRHPLIDAARALISERHGDAEGRASGATARQNQISNIWVARTCHVAPGFREERVACPADRYIFSIALEDVDVAIADGERSGRRSSMTAGAAYLASPGREVTIATTGPSDFLHLAVLSSFLDEQFRAAGLGQRRRRELDGLVAPDPMVEQVGRILVNGPEGWHASYAEILGQLVIARLLTLLPRSAPLTALPAWRLRKVQNFVEAQIASPLRLRDLAAIAGLSRMHFAAQFREATGHRPHDYVLFRRIERAKELIAARQLAMVEIALDVGFQSQAHFCTIFKRLTGVTPTGWRDGLRVPCSRTEASREAPMAGQISPAVH